ncbi:hypothetical protein JW977_02070 [Candidatus Falkowbacteria bacterium]|nr:hypothetical protein [Candidatus Falkowbacteria bacterium]
MNKTNDIIFEKLELLEQFIHLVPNEGIGVIDSVIRTKKPLKPKTMRIRGFGNLQGKSHDDLLEKCTNLLSKLRYLETQKSIKLLARLSNHQNQSIHSKALKAIEQISKYDFFALQNIGFRPQQILLNEIGKWNNRKILSNFDAVISILKELLQPSFEGHSNPDYKTISLRFGPLNVNDEIIDIRKRCIEFLKKIYAISLNIDQKTRIIRTFQEATQTPHQGGYGEDVENMVLDNTNTVMDFYVEIIPKSENEVIQNIEEQKIWFIRRFGKEKLPQIETLEEAIASNGGYSIFRVFVGYDGRLNPNYDFEKNREERSNKIEKFVNDITDENFKEWQNKILSVVSNYSGSDPGVYGYFNTFLEALGNKKPSIAMKLIDENENSLEPFLLSLVAGIWQSDSSQLIKNRMINWISEGKHLIICASVFTVVNEIDGSLLKKIFEEARELKDAKTLNSIINSIVHTYPKSKDFSQTFLDAIGELTKLKNTWWINHVWYKGETILKGLSDEEFEIILKNLNFLPSIDYHAEEILMPFAERRPEKVIDFFYSRVEEKTKKKRNTLEDQYDAIPFNLYKLKDVFKNNEEKVIQRLLQWYSKGGKKDKWLYRWEASHLLEDIFPDFSSTLERELILLVEKKDQENRDIVLAIINKYHNDNSGLWRVVRALVITYAEDKDYEKIEATLLGDLSQTGVVSGEYGLRDAYKRKKENLRQFKDCKNEKFQKFINNYGKYLDQRIAYEQKNTDEEIELMKRGL